MNRFIRISWLGIVLGLGALFTKWIVGSHSIFIEQVYGQTVFPIIRNILGWVVPWIPFPALFLVIFSILTILLGIMIQSWTQRKKHTWRNLIYYLTLRVGGLVGFLIFLFYTLWGFNYGRPDFKHRMQVQTSFLNDSAILQEFNWIQDSIIYYCLDPAVIEARKSDFRWGTEYNEEIQALVKEILQEFNFPYSGNVPLRKLKPKGILLCINTAGFYLPFTGEAQFDQGMYGLQWPYTAAHEYFHGFGVTNEGDCNFLAMLVCLRSDNPVIKYSGLVSYWRRVAREVYKFNKPLFREKSNALPVEFHQDLESIRNYLNRYPEIFPSVRNAVYNQYLKSHGIKEGMRSYNQVIILLHHYRNMEY